MLTVHRQTPSGRFVNEKSLDIPFRKYLRTPENENVLLDQFRITIIVDE